MFEKQSEKDWKKEEKQFTSSLFYFPIQRILIEMPLFSYNQISFYRNLFAPTTAFLGDFLLFLSREPNGETDIPALKTQEENF